eukprot:COSAG05_NODE_132_length_17128_cov_54.447355_3_plen_669_part_00
MFGNDADVSAISGMGAADVRSAGEISSILDEAEDLKDEDLLNMFEPAAAPQSGGGSGGGSGGSWNPGGGSRRGGSGGGGAGSHWTPGRSSGWTPGGGSSGGGGGVKRSQQNAHSKVAEWHGSHGTFSRTESLKPSNDDEFEISGSIEIDESVEVSDGGRSLPEAAPAPSSRPSNVHFGIQGLEAAEPAPAPSSRPSNVHFGIQGLEAAEPAPAPSSRPSNVHFGIEGLEAAEPAPTPSSRLSNVHFGIEGLEAAEPAPAPSSRPSNVHFGIEGLDAVTALDSSVNSEVIADTEDMLGESQQEMSAMDESVESANGVDGELDESLESAGPEVSYGEHQTNHVHAGGAEKHSQDVDEYDNYSSDQFEPSQNTSLDASGVLSGEERGAQRAAAPNKGGSGSGLAPAPAVAAATAAVAQAHNETHSSARAFEARQDGWRSAPISAWRALHVCHWLTRAMGLPDAARRAKTLAVDGLLIANMSEHELEAELGLDRPLHRKKLMLHIGRLWAADPASLSPLGAATAMLERNQQPADAIPRRITTSAASAPTAAIAAVPSASALAAETEAYRAQEAAAASWVRYELARIRTTARDTRTTSHLLISTLEQRKDAPLITLASAQAEIGRGRKKIDKLLMKARQWIESGEDTEETHARKLISIDKQFEKAFAAATPTS